MNTFTSYKAEAARWPDTISFHALCAKNSHQWSGIFVMIKYYHPCNKFILVQVLPNNLLRKSWCANWRCVMVVSWVIYRNCTDLRGQIKWDKYIRSNANIGYKITLIQVSYLIVTPTFNRNGRKRHGPCVCKTLVCLKCVRLHVTRRASVIPTTTKHETAGIRWRTWLQSLVRIQNESLLFIQSTKSLISLLLWYFWTHGTYMRSSQINCNRLMSQLHRSHCASRKAR
jgi:hypothetical protein